MTSKEMQKPSEITQWKFITVLETSLVWNSKQLNAESVLFISITNPILFKD